LNKATEWIIEAVDEPPGAGVFIHEKEVSKSRHHEWPVDSLITQNEPGRW
jgi:hypothetical protein